MSPGPRPISVPSGILINPAIWPQQTWAKNWEDCAPFCAPFGGSWVPISDHINYMISRYRSRIHRAYDIVAAIYRTMSCMNARLAEGATDGVHGDRRQSDADAAHILQQRRLRLIDVDLHAHRPWLPLPHVPCGRPIHGLLYTS